MRNGIINIGVSAALALVAVQCLSGAQDPPPPPGGTTGSEIFAQVEYANAVREARLHSFESMREYTVLEPGHAPDAELVVSMQFLAPSMKTFGQPSEQGVGWIHKRVFRGLMRAEQEAAAGTEKTGALVPANYDAQLVGEELCQGRECYVLALRPKHKSKYLLTGKVWVDKSDLAIARIEGDPVKSPSFWVERAHIVREYQRIGTFWLPLRDETRCRIRFAGDYVLSIRYYDYRITTRA